MALPVLAKTWQHDVNRLVAATGTAATTHKRVLRTIKDRLKAFSSNPWTVHYSCSSTVAGVAGDGVDRWAADADVVWSSGATAHSWIVLKQPAIDPNFQLLIECQKPAGGTLEGCIKASWTTHASGFTGGSTTVAPTATNSVSLRDGSAAVAGGFWAPTTGVADFTSYLHIQQSTDGESTRVFLGSGGFICGFWHFEKAIPCHTAWPNPVVACLVGAGSATNVNTYANFNEVSPATSTTPFATTRINGTNAQLHYTGEAHGGQVEGKKIQVANDASLDYHLGPIGLASDTSGARGRHGNLVDIWWANAGTANGTGAPASATVGSPLRQFMTMGNFLVPWPAVLPSTDGPVAQFT